jgi:pSer/pThr/pTyr-binding forkhead associated (FHA) protein
MLPTIVLSVLEDNRVCRTVRLPADQTGCVVGRSEECDLSLPGLVHATVSRRHCRIEVQPSAVLVRDLGSLNGTYVNGVCVGGRRCDPACDEGSCFPLHSGDEIRVGNTLLRIAIQASGRADEESGVPAAADFAPSR